MQAYPEQRAVDAPIENIWLEVLLALFLRSVMGGFPEGFGYPEADGHVRTINAAHTSAALALAGLRGASDAEEATRETDPAAHVAATARQSENVHAFLVAADSFWDAFVALDRVLPEVDDVRQQVKAIRWIAGRTRDARDHVEHRAERVSKGRRGACPMTAEEFRSAPGVVEGTRVTYGAETFDLEEIYRAIERVGEAAGGRLREILILKPSATLSQGTLTVQFGPSVQDDPFLRPLPPKKKKWEDRPPWAPPEAVEDSTEES